jgi:hypothetical protein
MASRAPQRNLEPKHFFLNEAHELAPVDKTGGGRVPEYVEIPWAQKARRLSDSISRARREVAASEDPLRAERLFVLARPVAELRKRSANERIAQDGVVREVPTFGGTQGRVFSRLGLDLIRVVDDGSAIVHADPERLDSLAQRAGELGDLGAREQVRWVAIDEFDTIPIQLRVDQAWLQSIRGQDIADVIFELQPILGRVDADRVVRAIVERLTRRQEGVFGSGSDFSGRYWFRGKASRGAIRSIAEGFTSVQSIHSPLHSVVMAARGRPQQVRAEAPRHIRAAPPQQLPCVALLDLGVPADHVHLAQARRGQFVAQDAMIEPGNDHGPFVASRLVFGHHNSPQELEEAHATCAFYDAPVAEGHEGRVNDKVVMDALRGVRGAAMDVRVFNLSFGDKRPLGAFGEVERREKRLLLQDLDNFIFAYDVFVVVAAGNSGLGQIPNTAYPNHLDDPAWALGSWACGFNTSVCGAYVANVSAGALVTTAGWPSPFSRLGPGLVDCPVPSFCAPGGNSTPNYRHAHGLGVWGYSGDGMAEDQCGTSFAAPLLAREAALALEKMKPFCPAGTVPFASTVRALLAASARPTASDPEIQELLRRAGGRGEATADLLDRASNDRVLLFWQGIVESSRDVVRVQFPVPSAWLTDALEPTLRVFVAYFPPVNEAATSTWACRRVNVTVHPGPEARGLRGSSREHDCYPLYSRDFKLKRYAPEGDRAAEGDMWVFDISYEEIFDYPPAMEFDPRQRVSVVAQLFDAHDQGLGPQVLVQTMPNATTMNRLSATAVAIRNPIVVRGR